MTSLIGAAMLAFAGGAAADDTTPLPRERPAATEAAASTPVLGVPLPRERPDAPAVVLKAAPASIPPEARAWLPDPVPIPKGFETLLPPAPPRIYQTACPAVISGDVVAKSLPPIVKGACGLRSPLSIEAVRANGRTIPLNTPVVTDCGMASALPAWVAEVDAYAAVKEKTTIAKVNVGTGYDCRNVDHAATGNLSFHAFGDAVDVIGFTLEDGRTVSIAPGFNGTPAQGHDILHFARDAACGRFTTVLSPDGDAFHEDNMHLDLGCHGKTCTARLCQ
ncbi:MAG: extensin family protein [Devosia sp.]